MLTAIIALLVGAALAGVFVYFLLTSRTERTLRERESSSHERLDTMLRAEQEKHRLAVAELERRTQDTEKRTDERERRIEEREKRLDENLQKLDVEKRETTDRKRRIEELESKFLEKEDRIEKKIEELDRKHEEYATREAALESERQSLDRERSNLQVRLAEIARLSSEEARTLLFAEIESRYERDIVHLIEKKKAELHVREKEAAREILIRSIQQYAGDVTSEMTQTMIHLDNDDIKGKLIGKEGRNIIAFERATGVSLIIDDTPDSVFISSFDLYRRFIAKKTVEQLIEDKRIQPARIEEIAEANTREAEKLIYELGEKTLVEMGITGIPSEMIPLIGKYRFRTSYGQNILTHAKEVAYIAEAIAKEVGADAALALKGGLLHDIGKSLDHDIEGTHPEIGGRIARKYGLSEKLTNIIEGHHDDVPITCIETKIVQIADAISSIRPGARRANADQYVKRIQEIENLAMSFSGVNKAYALSAGREIRVFVDADTVSDLHAEKLAQELAANIEANLNYPGEIKVNLIREKRFIEYAR